MTRRYIIAFRLFITSLLFCLCLVAHAQAQTTSSSPEPTPTPEVDPLAPEPAPPLPAGMTGSDANDPRAKLAPGMYNAGETSMGLKHLFLIKKPDAFQLGSNN